MNTKELEGKLSVWVGHRNFGFITRTTGNVVDRYFLHKTRIESGVPQVGAKVHFNVSPIKEGENPCAIEAVIEGGAQ
jgi:cold shock CspA family protein